MTNDDGKRQNIEFSLPAEEASDGGFGHVTPHGSPLRALASFSRLSTDFNALSLYINCRIVSGQTLAFPLRSLLKANQTLVSTLRSRVSAPRSPDTGEYTQVRSKVHIGQD